MNDIIPEGAIVDPHEENTVLCPVCRYNYSHVIEVFTRLGVDPKEGGAAYKGTLAKGVVPHERRDCLVIVFEGECGHVFEWQIQQHKGYNFVTAVYTGPNGNYALVADGAERLTPGE